MLYIRTLKKEPTPSFAVALPTTFHVFGSLDGMANHNRQMIFLTTLQGPFLQYIPSQLT